VETEIGRGVYPEMVKVQAILVRTYAISNLDRHATEGFSLCDGVHCQAYNGFRQYHAGIRKPVLSTRDLVLVKSDQQLALTVYHSNCGGKTANAADVWSGDVTTLVPVTDSFCTKSNNAKWEKQISRSEWENYLSACGLTDTMQVYKPLREAFQACNRTCCMRSDSVTVPLKNLRRDFDLKSSYFQISVNGDTVIFSGKGYGHGVGLCQEGGNAMAALGYTAEQILKFYYKGVSVVRYAEIQPH
jgi:stage II sporulation protein D